MANKITFTDYKSEEYSIVWFKRESTPIQPYIDRVVADKGTVEAVDCLREILNNDVDYNFECASTLEPLSFRWHGENRYSNIRGSEIAFRVLIRNDEEAALMADMLNGGYYVNILYYNDVIWIGKCEPSFYTEAYRQYPYTLEISASDQLGLLKQSQPLMIDWPLPWPDRNISIMDFLNHMLTLPDFNPSAYYPTAPSKINVSARLYYTRRGTLLEDLYFDPLVFMDESNDQYLSYYDIVTNILEPLHLTIMQWSGRWYIISLDAMWDAGNIEFRQYGINSAGWAFESIWGYDNGVLDLYNNPQHQQVFNNAQMSYLPAWRKLTIEQNFQSNGSVLDAFANRNGMFYYGQDGIQLEWDADGRILNHWTYEDGNLETIAVNRNSGLLAIPMIWTGDVGGSKVRVQNIKSLTDIKDGINISLHWEPLVSYQSIQKLEVKLNVDGTDYWFWNNDTAEEQFYGWAEDYHLLVLTEPGDFSVEAGLPSTVDAHSIGKLTIGIHQAEWIVQGIPATYMLIRNFQVTLADRDWKEDTFTTDAYLEINPFSSYSLEERDFRWAISHPNNENDHSLHYSTAYDVDRNLVPELRKDGVDTGSLLRTPVNWLITNFSDDNTFYTPQLSASFRNSSINPFRLIYDYEKRVYGWQNAEWVVRGGYWSVTYTQYNSVRNLPDAPVKCDFSTFDFNNDFCTEIASGVLYDYIVRVTADGGTVEAASCVQDAINNLSQ